MSSKTTTRLCRNPKCQKSLPADYPHKYCEACRNNQAKAVKNVGESLAAIVTVLFGAAVTGGKIKNKKS